MSDSFIQVAPDSTGKKVDNSQLTQTGGGVVQRQRVTNGDAVNVNNLQKTDSSGNSYIREAVSITENDASLSVSTSAQTAVNASTITLWLKIQNCSQSGQVLGYTTDGSTPVIGAAGTLLLLPYGSDIFDKRLPAGAVKVVGSAASTIATIKYV